jgi:hypothetical protein
LGYTPPQCLQTPASSQQKAAIAGAFGIAPSGLQAELCGLTQIFIMPVDQQAWGKWEDPAYHPIGGATYIAVSVSDMSRSVSTLKNGNLLQLGIPETEAIYDADVPLPGGNRARIGLLSVLAHEVGHIIWHRDGRPCESVILSESWSGPVPTPRWVDFADDFGTPKSIGHKAKNATGAQLQAIFDKGFMTGLASMSPEEDFVETYMVAAIGKKGLKDLFISIKGKKTKVNGRMNNPALKAKFACVSSLLGS